MHAKESNYTPALFNKKRADIKDPDMTKCKTYRKLLALFVPYQQKRYSFVS